jgi:hypothetical protein
MKNSLAIITFLLISQVFLGQKSYNYIKSADEVKGKRTVYTEIDIDASTELVRSKFLEFSKWSKWCKVIPEIKILSGDIDNLETKPKLDLTLDFGRKKDPQKSPMNPIVSVNTKDVFVWGIYNGFLIKAEHVFVFEPINNSRGTHLIHYERMTGIFSPFIITKKLKKNMTNRYNIMNQNLKKFVNNNPLY